MAKLLPRRFFSIQILCAERAAEIENITLPKSLFAYTSLPIRFGISFSELREDHPVWQRYLNEISASNNLEESTYGYYLDQEKNLNLNNSQFNDRFEFGCFSYNLLKGEKGVLLHFANKDDPEPGALSNERQPQRLEELKTLFSDIKQRYPDYEFVVSSSWLYNVNAFTRLFPSEFVSSKQVKFDYCSMGIWGQFLDKFGECKANLCDQFEENIKRANTLDELYNSFPLKDLKLVCDLIYFYKMYQV